MKRLAKSVSNKSCFNFTWKAFPLISIHLVKVDEFNPQILTLKINFPNINDLIEPRLNQLYNASIERISIRLKFWWIQFAICMLQYFGSSWYRDPDSIHYILWCGNVNWLNRHPCGKQLHINRSINEFKVLKFKSFPINHKHRFRLELNVSRRKQYVVFQMTLRSP